MMVLTVLTYVFLSFFLGTFLIGLCTKVIDLGLVATYFGLNILPDFYAKSIVFLCGLLIILVCLRYIQSLVITKEKSIKCPQGKVSLTFTAIEDMIKKILEDKKEISRVRPKITVRKKGIEISIRSDLNAEVNLIDLANEIQETIENKLHRLFGEKEEIRVKIKIRKISFGGSKIEEDEPEIPFRSYNY